MGAYHVAWITHLIAFPSHLAYTHLGDGLVLLNNVLYIHIQIYKNDQANAHRCKFMVHDIGCQPLLANIL